MLKKIMSFLVTIILVVLLFLTGVILYQNFAGNNELVSSVENFVTEATTIGEAEKENIETPNVLQKTIDSDLDSTNVNYEGITVDKYFYNQLPEYSKTIYKALETNKNRMKSGTYEINLGDGFSGILSQSDGAEKVQFYYQAAIDAFLYDNPDVFYLDPSKMYLNIETTTKITRKTYKLFINSGDQPNYLSDGFPSEQSVNNATSRLQAVRNYFIQNKTTNDYNNIKMAHDYLVDSIEYTSSSGVKNLYNIYGALVNKQCVCEGYAKAFKYLMDGMNVPCVMVIGTARNSNGVTENHAWNYVQVNGTWYPIDVTWDDPIIIGGGRVTNDVKYKYFLISEARFNENHFPENKFTPNGMDFKYPILSQSGY